MKTSNFILEIVRVYEYKGIRGKNSPSTHTSYTHTKFQIGNFLGYTMVELLVVIAIMAILAVVAIGNYGNLQKDQALQKATSNAQSFIRTAQTNATARLACPPDSTGTGGASWIVSFPTTSSMSFSCQLGTSSENSVKSFALDGGVIVQRISDSSSNNCSATSIKLTFAPLYGNVTFSDTANCISPTTSILKIRLLAPSGKFKDLQIDKGGAVYEQ